MDGLTLSKNIRESLVEALGMYQSAMPGSRADRYLQERQIGRRTQADLCLGFVGDNPAPGHEAYRGRLAIPYFGATGTLGTIRFRSVPDAEGNQAQPKMLGIPGHESRPYNVKVLMEDLTEIAICEGETDTMTVEASGAIRAVGIPGAQAWNNDMAKLFTGYKTVYVLADNDDSGAGMEFAKKVAKSVRNSYIVSMPDGEDVNSLVCKKGFDALIERMGLDQHGS